MLGKYNNKKIIIGLCKAARIPIIDSMYSIVILAGGKSSRMGFNKTRISLAGKTMLERVLAKIELEGNEIIIVSNEDLRFPDDKITIVPDFYRDYGALAGLHAGLKAANNDQVLVVAIDMLFINIDLFNYMKKQMVPGIDVVIPCIGNSLEPFHALYRRSSCLPAIENAIQTQSKRIISFFPLVKVVKVDESVIAAMDPDGLAFFNINTPEDLQRAEQIIAQIEKPSSNS